MKYQFGTSLSGPWHDTMQANDKYRRDSLDGGTTWGAAYQFKGTDGKNGSDGSDAKVPKYIKDTYIDSVEIRSPTIKANDYYIYPYDESDSDGTFNIYGMYNSKQWHMFQIAYYGGGDTPEIYLHSPDDGYLHIGSQSSSGMTYFDGNISLRKAKILDWGDNHPTAVLA